ncbi:unnamed protein product [Cylicostephanus goldi]|uniref:Uncharacterized protein n=1 Tax=Cylicostephanus goldi TaxID=71465 RepID=A0A3P6UCN5_CYLGO|nr:unnamed protein product [Cylicostephanus goldi]
MNESWTMCAGKTRLFNNVAIRLKSIEEANEYAESIAEQICVTIKLCIDKEIPVQNVERMPLPKSSTAARKALTSVTAALKNRMLRPPLRTNPTKFNSWEMHLFWSKLRSGLVQAKILKLKAKLR